LVEGEEDKSSALAKDDSNADKTDYCYSLLLLQKKKTQSQHAATSCMLTSPLKKTPTQSIEYRILLVDAMRLIRFFWSVIITPIIKFVAISLSI